MSESAIAGWASAVLGETLAELDQLEEAVVLAEEGVRLTLKSHNVIYAGWAAHCLARTLYSSGRLAKEQEASAFPPAERAEAERPQVDAANSELFEPLSDRELDVLRLIAEGLSNQEISGRLSISLHTVKSHAGNLYAKLEVNSRTSAVGKARDLGLLPPV
jgi:LuxR family maltose regulon positive regulatory protein